MLGSGVISNFHNCISTGVILLDQRVGGIASVIGGDIDFINVFYDVTKANVKGASWDNVFADHYNGSVPNEPSADEMTYSTGARTTEQMKSEEILNTLNEFVDENPDLGLLHWETGASGYPCLIFPANGTGSTLSEGNGVIVAVVGGVAVLAVAGLVIWKKRKPKAAEN